MLYRAAWAPPTHAYPIPSSRDQLIQRLRSREARLGVIGLGYVGLPLALEFAKTGFVTVGVDLDEDKVGRISAGDPCGIDVSGAEVVAMTASGRLTATTEFSRLQALDCVNICVPTHSGKRKIRTCRTSYRRWRRSPRICIRANS